MGALLRQGQGGVKTAKPTPDDHNRMLAIGILTIGMATSAGIGAGELRMGGDGGGGALAQGSGWATGWDASVPMGTLPRVPCQRR